MAKLAAKFATVTTPYGDVCIDPETIQAIGHSRKFVGYIDGKLVELDALVRTVSLSANVYEVHDTPDNLHQLITGGLDG